jgi:hypothetical protein
MTTLGRKKSTYSLIFTMVVLLFVMVIKNLFTV